MYEHISIILYRYVAFKKESGSGTGAREMSRMKTGCGDCSSGLSRFTTWLRPLGAQPACSPEFTWGFDSNFTMISEQNFEFQKGP